MQQMNFIASGNVFIMYKLYFNLLKEKSTLRFTYVVRKHQSCEVQLIPGII